jgi:Xaa-Pro aminopeptidase
MSSPTTSIESGIPARIARARTRMSELELPAVLLTQMVNIGWISGFTGSSGFVILTPERALFATDSRYVTQAAEQCPDFEQVKLASSAPDEITELLSGLKVSRIGFEAGHLTVQTYNTYREKLPAEIDFVATDSLIDNLRQIKDAEEIACMERACALADCAFQHILPFIKPGAVERDVMLELEWFMRKEGGAEVAFDTIVASGPRSALPHGRAADRVMQPGDFVTLDFGARLDNYCSDITRTVVLGAPSDEQKKVYQTVHDALERSIAGIRPGAGGKEVDSIARDLIRDAGYGDYFGHGLGHGLGRLVHDGQGFSPRSTATLVAGMVLTVEPGIYIPDWGGVRIEHDVLVTEDGARVLTHSTTELLSL